MKRAAFWAVMPVSVVVLIALASFAHADTFGSDANQFDIDFVTIPGAAGDGYGGQSAGAGFTTTNIDYDYRIGTYEITNDQWNRFVAELDVSVTGSPSSAYDASAYWTGASVPMNEVSWYEAAQFVNWLNTSTGHHAAYKFTGTLGQSNYALSTWDPETEAWGGTNVYRHEDAFYFLPDENEWVKAAYWNGTSLQQYAMKAGETLQQGDGTSGTGWNYYDDGYATNPRGPWDVGSGSEELNGTYDMMGNLLEWMESPHSDPNYGADSSRGMRGGVYDLSSSYLQSSNRVVNNIPWFEGNGVGFRVASCSAGATPEPTSILVWFGLGCVALIGWRRRK